MSVVRRGLIVATCISPDPGIGKKRVDKGVVLGTHGIVGDYHNREMRPSYSQSGTQKPNFWHVTMFDLWVIHSLNRDSQLEGMPLLGPGSLGENLVVDDLGDLSDVADGTQFSLNGGAIVLETVEHMLPCQNLTSLHRLLGKRLLRDDRNRRGLYLKIIQGSGERILPGAEIFQLE